ncbi:MAG: response regulator [Deltaproteobacteria bacterium]|jgi:DNA-binding response OmpR family regulator|nr:response regulator [Deltaproteobacteria bacterium]
MEVQYDVAAPRILIVDDDMMIHKLLGAILHKAGFECLNAHSGEEGLEIARKDNPELVILDIMMPSMNGFEVMRALKANPETADIPVIFLSGKFHNHEKTEARELGAADFMEKPFERNELLARIKTYLTLKRQENNITFFNQRLVQMARDALGLINQGRSASQLTSLPEDLAKRMNESTQKAQKALTLLENQWVVFSAFVKPYLAGQGDDYFRDSLTIIPDNVKELKNQLEIMTSISRALNAICGLSLPDTDTDTDGANDTRPN